ncbi:MAG: DUF4007 family protein [Ignavibacteria bacterium]
MDKLNFSGHETFVCRQSWLKKGYDFVKAGFSFSNESAVIHLGVGKNMVTAIRYWLKSFALINEDETPTELAEYIFADDGRDPYLEDIGTIWLLHYFLIKTKKASIYHLIFNLFRREERPDFQRHSLLKFLKSESFDTNSRLVNESTLINDVSVFVRSYSKSNDSKKDIEEEMTGLLKELNILKLFKYRSELDNNQIELLSLQNNNSSDVPFQIILFAIIDNEQFGKSVSLNELLKSQGSVGRIFLINSELLIDNIKLMEEKYSGITFSETSGNQVIQFKNKPNKWKVLDDYYKT